MKCLPAIEFSCGVFLLFWSVGQVVLVDMCRRILHGNKVMTVYNDKFNTMVKEGSKCQHID